MATRVISYADFGGTETIPAAGELTIEFPTNCSSLILYLSPNIGDDFEVMVNPDDAERQGPTAEWNKDYVTLPAGIILTLPEYRINSFIVRSTNGSVFSYWGFVSKSAPTVNYTYTE